MTEIKKLIAAAVSEAEGLSAGDIEAMLEYPPDSAMGDIALPCFKLSKTLRKSPVMIASELKEKLALPEIGRIESVGGYLNFYVSPNYYAEELIPEILSEKGEYGKSTMGAGKTVVLDYSAPNICKPFHIGHFASTVIGHSLKKLHEFCGYKCVGVNHLGDWGTQFGKQITAYKLWGDRAAVEKLGVDELVRLYVKFHEEAEKDPSLNDRARAEFAKLEEGDPENTELWKWFVKISLDECNKTYKRLGIDFDSYAGESFYTDKMQEQVDLLREKGLLKIDNGASIVDLSEYNMPPCLILKSDGSTLYPTRDIAAAVYRDRTYHFDKCIYVTAYQQCLHFKQWFKVVELMGYDFADKLVHVPYGMVSIDGAKLATRTGNVILIRDLLSAAVDKVTDVINEKNPSLENKEQTAEAVGIGAVIFHYLLNNRIKDVNFVMEDALSFDGNTGPYAQYTYARTCSILEKAGEVTVDGIRITEPAEAALCKVLSQFGEAVLSAVADYEPSDVTRYILDVCTAFNRFYHDCPILSADDETARKSRVALTQATNYVLGNALPLICLKTPEKI
ncbi:MAG: arginine--tRNA ligase [Eubacteriales bacterium]|nr:arginine--tRNA ligase [Eubacteriales bacterium]MDD7573466.1 arginine--tRNA ligase [Eubacteriales bacterium]